MSDPRLRTLFWSISLILSGVVLLLFNLGALAPYTPLAQYILAAGCALVALVWFASFAWVRQEWWRLIPAWTLLALAGMIMLTVWPGANQALVAALLFIGLSFAFAHIYLLDRRERWWAIIPGGFMLVLGIVIALNDIVVAREHLAAIMFIGMGVVFFLLYLLDDRRRQWWALIPGTVLVIFGALVLSADQVSDNALLRWWPVALIGIGIVVGLQARRKPAPAKLTVHAAPKVKITSAPAAPSGSKPSVRGTLGEYTQPAPGATVEVLPDTEE